MAGDKLLSQDEIDSVFKKMRETGAPADSADKAPPYDFRRPDRIAKDQLRAIHILHENFARSLASSLSAYLRARGGQALGLLLSTPALENAQERSLCRSSFATTTSIRRSRP